MNWDVRVEVMDPSPEAPCHLTTRFVQADLKDADAVVAFGQGLDAITVEIEHVSVEGLQVGRPRRGSGPAACAFGLDSRQRPRCKPSTPVSQAPPTSSSRAWKTLAPWGFPSSKNSGRAATTEGRWALNTPKTHKPGFDAPCVLEQAMDIDKELSVIVARNKGETAVYPVVEAVFNPEVNLVDHLMAPAAISPSKNPTRGTWPSRW